MLNAEEKMLVADALRRLEPERLLAFSMAGPMELRTLVQNEIERRTLGCTIWGDKKHRYDDTGFCKCGSYI
jgi:hypothetical protein